MNEKPVTSIFPLATALIIFAISAGCSSTQNQPDTSTTNDVLITADLVQTQDLAASDTISGRDESIGNDSGDIEDDLSATDTTPVDTVTQDEGSTDEGQTVAAGPYGQCDVDGECNSDGSGLECFKFPDSKFGYCTKGCTENSDCPQSPTLNPVGCQKDGGQTTGTCVSLCGAVGNENPCPPWLDCVSSQFCLPPSTTIASKEVGEACTGPAECLSGECIEGQATRAHCAGKCVTNDDCKGPEGKWSGTCTAGGGLSYNFCIYMCGMMASGAVCPGDLECVGMSVCQ
jgi:hypothetical protein